MKVINGRVFSVEETRSILFRASDGLHIIITFSFSYGNGTITTCFSDYSEFDAVGNGHSIKTKMVMLTC